MSDQTPEADHGSPSPAPTRIRLAAKARWVEHFERTYLPNPLERTDGNVSKAAREAQMDRAYLFRLLRRYGLKD